MRKGGSILIVIMTVVAISSLISCEKNNDTESSVSKNDDIKTSVTWVDLGLPSGLLWADCNIGAVTPEKKGTYFAWGETLGKSEYKWDNYRFCKESTQLTKYCSKSDFGYQGYTDNLKNLEPSDDAATSQLGNVARTPTIEEWQELIENTTRVWTKFNNVEGCRFTATNGNSLFLPEAGLQVGSYPPSHTCDYWSSTLNTSSPSQAYIAGMSASGGYITLQARSRGLPVRAVCSLQP